MFFFAFDILLRAFDSARKMPVCKCFAFLTYFILLSSFLSLRSVLSFLVSAIYFSRGLCPHPFAFCKKRNQKLLFLFLCVLIFYLYKQVGCQRTTTNALRSENATHFRLPLTACLFFIASLCLSFFTAASLFFRGLCPHPFAF